MSSESVDLLVRLEKLMTSIWMDSRCFRVDPEEGPSLLLSGEHYHELQDISRSIGRALYGAEVWRE